MDAGARRWALSMTIATLGAGCGRDRAGQPSERASERGMQAPVTGRASRARRVDEPIVIALPTAADARFHVRELRSGVGAAVRAAEAIDGGTITHEVLPDGVEDWIVLPRRGGSTLRWSFEPTAKVAGLRLIDGVLELLDGGGAPRLRVERPYTIDARGARRPAWLDVEGCPVDRDPAAPWGRAPAALPSACTLLVRFDAEAPRYPLRVDPAWRATTKMAVARASHAAVRLASGKVLAVGGAGADPSSAELFDPATATWATTAAKTAIGRSAPVQLADGGWLFVGAPSVVYDAASGAWITKAAPKTARLRAPAVRLASGKVLVAGGLVDASTATSAVEIYEPATDAWTTAASLPDARAGHAAVTLASGAVLVAGGTTSAAAGPSKSALRYDPSSDAWSAAADLPDPSDRAIATLLGDGRVFLHGIRPAIYDPTADVWSPSTGSPSAKRGTAEALLASGKVLAAGGVDGAGGTLSAAELYEPGGDLFAAAGALVVARSDATATPLPSGALVTGGLDATGAALRDAELLGDAPDGAPCAARGECLAGSWCDAGSCAPKRALGEGATDGAACASGFAADGHCCDVACDGPCGACDRPGSVGTCTAVTGAPTHGACPAATGGDPCGARACDGASIARCDGYVGAEVACRAHACVDGVETAAASCAGAGACPAATTITCAPYVCEGKQCRTSCRSDADCLPNAPCDVVAHVCVPKVCVDEQSAPGPTGLPYDCSPFRCADGACLLSCESTADCLPAYNCDLTLGGRCVPNAAGTGSSESGGCHASKGASGSALAALGLTALGLARRARGRRGPRS